MSNLKIHKLEQYSQIFPSNRGEAIIFLVLIQCCGFLAFLEILQLKSPSLYLDEFFFCLQTSKSFYLFFFWFQLILLQIYLIPIHIEE